MRKSDIQELENCAAGVVMLLEQAVEAGKVPRAVLRSVRTLLSYAVKKLSTDDD